MISDIKVPKTKSALIKALNKISPLKFSIYECQSGFDSMSINTLTKSLKKGSYTIIVIHET